jgi:hypothetical protein
MKEYRPDDVGAAVGPSSSTAVNPPSQFLQFMIDYDEEQADQDTSLMEETIDEEYTGYVNSLPKRPVELDPLKFWEVSIYKIVSAAISLIFTKKFQDKPRYFPNSLQNSPRLFADSS